MSSFEHQHCVHARISVRVESDQSIKTVLLIETRLRMPTGEPGFDGSDLDDLVDASVEYMKTHSIDSVDIVPV